MKNQIKLNAYDKEHSIIVGDYNRAYVADIQTIASEYIDYQVDKIGEIRDDDHYNELVEKFGEEWRKTHETFDDYQQFMTFDEAEAIINGYDEEERETHGMAVEVWINGRKANVDLEKYIED